MRGNDYSRVVAWYKLLINHAEKLVDLLESENQDNKIVLMTMRVLKAGLFSKSHEVVNLCLRFISKIHSICFNNPAHKGSPESCAGLLYEWMVGSDSYYADMSYLHLVVL